MPKGILYVETRLRSPEHAEEYFAWYADHLRLVVGHDGFVAARHFGPVDDDGPFVAMYEMDADDLVAARLGLRAAAEAGELPAAPAYLDDEPPLRRRLLQEIATHRLQVGVPMAKGILYVATRPLSSEHAAEYHEWYERHLPDVVAVDGIVAARRFAPIGDDGPFVAIYEIEADDLEAARSRLVEARREGKLANPGLVQVDPPPVVRLLELKSADVPESSEAPS